MSVRIVRKAYTVAIVLLPLLAIYKGIGNSIDLGTLCVLILFLGNVFIVRKRIKVLFPQDWMIYLLYMVIITTIVTCGTKGSLELAQIALRLMKNVMYIVLFLVACENEFYMINFGKKIYMFVVGITTMYVYLQVFAAKYMNNILWGYIPQLVKKTSYVDDIRRTAPSAFRPSSLFYEPSHYFIYVFVALVMLLFSEKKCNLRKMTFAMIVTGGVILSTTSMGILFVAMLWFVWGIWKVYQNYQKKKTEIVFLIVCILVILGAAVMLNSAKVLNALERVFDASYKGGNAIAGRGMGYFEITQMPLLNFFLGYGYGNVGSDYYPSMAYNFLSMGLVGSLLIFVLYYNIYKKMTLREEKIAFFVYVILCFYGEIFMSYYLCFFMCMFMYKRNSNCSIYNGD